MNLGGNHFVHGKAMEIEILCVKKYQKRPSFHLNHKHLIHTRKIILFTKKIETNPMINPSFHGPKQISTDEFGGSHFDHGKAKEIKILCVKK